MILDGEHDGLYSAAITNVDKARYHLDGDARFKILEGNGGPQSDSVVMVK